jgi:hypothetical protein
MNIQIGNGKKKGGSALNMLIAKTQTFSGRVLGMQLSGGTLIGVGLSAMQMSVGFLIIGGAIIKGNFLMAALIFLVGCALAVLVERLSLGGLSGMRVAKEDAKKLKEAYYAKLEAEQREPTELEKQRYEEEKAELVRDRKNARGFAILGIVLSAGVGDVFWHALFAGLGIIGYVLSVACAAVISLTFIHSELFKGTVDGVLKHIIADWNLMKVAVAAEGSNVQLGMMVDSYDEVRADEEARRSAKEKIKKAIIRRMERFAVQAAAAGDEIDQINGAGVRVVESSLAPLALPAPRGKYPQYRDELRRLLSANPQLTQRDVAAHFSISRSTAKDWFDRLQRGE